MYKAFYLPFYEDGNFGLETVIAVISKEPPQLDYGLVVNRELRKEFLISAVNEDEDAASFFKSYYNAVKAQRYKCMDKVCKIRELPPGNMEDFSENNEAWFDRQRYMKTEDSFFSESNSGTCKEEPEYFTKREDYSD